MLDMPTLGDLDLHLWTILSFELWCRRFLDDAGRGARRPKVRERRLWSPAIVQTGTSPSVSTAGAPRQYGQPA